MKIRYVRWLCALCVTVCLLLSACSCMALRTLPDHRERGFVASVRWESEGVTVCAEVEAACREGEGARICRVTLSTPPALAGAILEECEDGVAMTVEGVRVVSAGAAEIWRDCSLLVLDGEMREICDTEWQGLTVRYSEIGEGENLCGLFRDCKTGAPLRLEQGDRVMVVERFVHT